MGGGMPPGGGMGGMLGSNGGRANGGRGGGPLIIPNGGGGGLRSGGGPRNTGVWAAAGAGPRNRTACCTILAEQSNTELQCVQQPHACFLTEQSTQFQAIQVFPTQCNHR